MAEITFEDAAQKARDVHFDAEPETPHPADGVVEDTLMAALMDDKKATRRGRAIVNSSKGLWDPDSVEDFADRVDSAPEDFKTPESELDQDLEDAGIMEFEDQFTAERMRNRRTETLTRFVEDFIKPATPVVDNFFTTVQQDAGTSLGQLQEFVDFVESFSRMGYYPIDPDRGEIPSFSPGMTQASTRVNPRMSMYGVKVEYEDKLHRVVDNFDSSEIIAMATVGWAQASAEARERDASTFLFNHLSPQLAMSNTNPDAAPLGTASGVAINTEPNGTLDVDHDVPRIVDFMEHEVGMSLADLRGLLPRNAWPFLNMRKGYRRFLGRDDEPLYESPSMEEGPEAALSNVRGNERYGTSAQGVGYESPAAAAKYLQGTRESEAAQAAEQLAPGPLPFLPRRIPNWMNEFRLPNSAFGPMTLVLTPFAQAEHQYYPKGHPLRDDDRTGNKRPVMTTDFLLFDGTRPLHLIESIPPTSWDATNEQYGKSMMIMVEGYALANRSRGEQAIKLEGMVLDDNYTQDIQIEADKLEITDHPMAGDSNEGLQSA